MFFMKPVQFLMALSAIALMAFSAEKISYPPTAKIDHTDTYFGTSVPDPYRWLEDDNSPETAKWVEDQNRATFSYLEKIPFRGRLRQRLEQLYNYPKYGQPFRRGDLYFFSKNDGLQNQSVLYVQKGLDGKPEVLIDPNKFSADGTARLGAFAVSRDGRYAGYGISRSGSDWQEYYVLDVASRANLADQLRWIKVSGLAWQGNGFYYSRYDEPQKGTELSSKNEGHKVFYHKVGTPQSADTLVYEDKANPQRFHTADTTEDERFVILIISDRGKGKKGNAIFIQDTRKADRTWRPLIPEIGDDSFHVVDNVGDKLLVQTDHGATNGKVVLIDSNAPAESGWREILPERAEPLGAVATGGGKLFATHTKDVIDRPAVYSLDGKLENQIPLPDLGTAGGFSGQADDTSVFYTFSSFTYPPAIFRYDIATRKSSVFRAPEIPNYRAADFETRQVFYTSKDGTRVPMFIVHRKGLRLDGNNPALLYGYGGFNISTSPGFNPLRLALLEQGFVYASANIRGGAEYGEKWHEAGTRLKKQNVFDDFIAAAEYLIANKYTSSARLAVQGGSNGGLLVGAVMNQRPELFRVGIPQVGVMDMLRFQKFTIGWNWIPDYGSSDNADEFKALYRYSPLHNIRKDVRYPATLVTTADHDDRVVPAHSFKYAATMQELVSPENPVLIRIDTRSGHGSSSTTKALDMTADVNAFIMFNLGISFE
jgi:prolyl oligopeptidase